MRSSRLPILRPAKRVVGLALVLLALGGAGSVAPQVVGALASPRPVGALTPFNMANALSLGDYCNGSDALDDSTCISTWKATAQAQGKHMYVPAGTYYYSSIMRFFNGAHLRCENPLTTVFKGNGTVASFFHLILAESGGTEPYEDVLVENCGFDSNGTTVLYASAIVILGTDTLARNITIRGNRMFDSTMPGSMYTDFDKQRQYIVTLNVEDVLIEYNTLSEGGRIKAANPGRRIVIRYNTLNNINDNGITVVASGAPISTHMHIHHNRITNALGSGIFFGSDGQDAVPGLVTTDMVITDNEITGFMRSSCITGTLPDVAQRIYLARNTCRKTDVPTSNAGGLTLIRTNAPADFATQVTIVDNIVTSDVADAFDTLAGIYVASRYDTLCIINNEVSNQSLAMRIYAPMTNVKVTGNTLHGGTFLNTGGVTVDTSGNTDGCYFPKMALR